MNLTGEDAAVTSSMDKLTIQALKQHDKIHPKFKASTSPKPGETAGSKSKGSQAASEGSRRRTTSVVSDSAPKVAPPKRSSMSIFRLVAATRTWQRLAKKKREAPPIPVKYENTYQLEPDEKSRFSPSKVEAILKDVLETRLKNVRYNPEQCRRVTTELVGIIKARTKTCHFDRYKLVCNVLIMENKGQGSQVVSRGLTNADTDSFAAYTFRNTTLVAVAHVHGLYFE